MNSPWVTLQQRLYRLYKSGEWVDSAEFKLYRRLFTDEKIKAWIETEQLKEREQQKGGIHGTR